MGRGEAAVRVLAVNTTLSIRKVASHVRLQWLANNEKGNLSGLLGGSGNQQHDTTGNEGGHSDENKKDKLCHHKCNQGPELTLTVDKNRRPRKVRKKDSRNGAAASGNQGRNQQHQICLKTEVTAFISSHRDFLSRPGEENRKR